MPRISTDISPTMSVGKTQAELEDQGLTYNEAGISYNESGIFYGGVFGASLVFPLISMVASISPHMYGGDDVYTTINPNANYTPLGPGFLMYITVPQ